jgi:hypothetical protein
MGYVDGEIVESTTSEDGTRRMDIIRRPDGVCRFVEDFLDPGDDHNGPYWRETHHSGLYPDLPAARIDAVAALPWLRRHR